MRNPINRPKSLREVVEEYICQKITSGEWPQDFRLPAINDLSEQLNVSHTTTREAIQRLGSVGLLEIRQGLGTFVRMVPGWLRNRPEAWRIFMQEEAIQEIIEARELLEVQLAGLAALRRTEEEIDHLYAGLAELEKAIEMRADDYDKIDLLLHEIIWKASHNRIFLQMMQAVYGQLEEVIRIVALNTTDMEKLLPMHASVVEAISAGDPEAARRKMQAHFESIREDLLLAAKQVTNE